MCKSVNVSFFGWKSQYDFPKLVALCYEQTSPLAVSHTASGTPFGFSLSVPHLFSSPFYGYLKKSKSNNEGSKLDLLPFNQRIFAKAKIFIHFELRISNFELNTRYFMNLTDYILTKIEGEYAYLRDIESGNEVFIALALLPVGADIGSKIHCEMLEYTLAD